MLKTQTKNITLESIAAALDGEVSGDKVLAPGPAHSPKDRSLCVRLTGGQTGGFIVHSFANQDDLFCKDYVRERLGLPAFNSRGQNEIEYVYRDENGKPYIKVTRTPSKAFPQAHWNGTAWKSGVKGIAKIPYRLPELLASSDEPVHVVEGEKDADRLGALGLVVTTSSGGAGNWKPELNRWFKGRKVFVHPDNDKPGEDHAHRVAANLNSVASDVRIVTLPNLPSKGDISDWLNGGGTVEELEILCEAAPRYVANDDTAGVAEASAETPDRPAVVASRFVYRDPKTIPPRESLYCGHFFRGFLSETVGVGGGGKSSLEIADALAMITGRSLLGHLPPNPLKVWYVNLEDPAVEIERRFAAAIKHFHVDPKIVEANLFMDSGRDQNFVVMKSDGRGVSIAEPTVTAIIQQLKDNRIDVLVVDPFISAHEVDENNNSQIQQVAGQFVRIATEANVSVELVHHINKSSGDGRNEVTADSGRGASALKDKARSVRVINPMTDPEATKAGVNADNRYSYFRIGNGKSNMMQRSGLSEWRKLESVSLGNNPTVFEPGDQIGVVTEWRWPKLSDVVSEVPAEKFAEIKSRIRNGGFRENHQAKNWAGKVVAEVLSLNLDKDNDKSKIKSFLAAWTRQGHFAVVTRKGEKRTLVPYLIAVDLPDHEEGGAGKVLH